MNKSTRGTQNTKGSRGNTRGKLVPVWVDGISMKANSADLAIGATSHHGIDEVTRTQVNSPSSVIKGDSIAIFPSDKDSGTCITMDLPGFRAMAKANLIAMGYEVTYKGTPAQQ